MMNFYQVINTQNAEVVCENIDLLYADDKEIYQCIIKSKSYTSGIHNQLDFAEKICDANKDLDINEYVFDSPKYNEDPLKTFFKAINTGLIPGNYYPRIYRP